MAVKPEAIRLARIEAGLSLDRLAAGVVSRQAVHQIERGQIRPSPEVLLRLAERLGRPIADFLEEASPGEPAARLAELERLVLTREHEAAARVGAELLAERGLSASQRAKALLWLGAAQVGLSRPAEAMEPLRESRRLAATAADLPTEIEAMDWTACALHLTDSPGAIPLAEEALMHCRAIRPMVPALEARILGHLGSFLVRRREWSRALVVYEEAVAVAAPVSDLRQLALMHHNLAIAHQRLGNRTAATREAERALALFEAQSNRADLARMQSDYGDLLRRQGRLTEARGQLQAALETFRSAQDARGSGYTTLTLAEVAIAEGDHRAAQLHLDEVAGLPEGADDSYLCAYAARVGGRLAAARSQFAEAGRWFETAIASFQALGQDEWAAETHYEYAEALEAAGDLPLAMKHLRQAARGAISRDQEAQDARVQAEATGA